MKGPSKDLYARVLGDGRSVRKVRKVPVPLAESPAPVGEDLAQFVEDECVRITGAIRQWATLHGDPTPVDRRVPVCTCPEILGWNVAVSGHRYNCPLRPDAAKQPAFCMACAGNAPPHLHGATLFCSGKEVF